MPDKTTAPVRDGASRRPIESASASTAPQSASGFAYVVTAAVLSVAALLVFAVALLLCTAVAGMAGMAGGHASAGVLL